MPNLKENAVVCATAELNLHISLNGLKAFFPWFKNPSEKKVKLETLSDTFVAAPRNYITAQMPGMRQWVGYGLHYVRTEQGQGIKFALHLKTKTEWVDGIERYRNVLSLGVGHHVPALQVLHRAQSGNSSSIGEAIVDLAREGVIVDSYFTGAHRLQSKLMTGAIKDLGIVAASVEGNHKTNHHAGVVFAYGLPGDVQLNMAEGEHFVGFFTVDELVSLNVDPELVRDRLIFNHNGFEPWAKLILNHLEDIGNYLSEPEETKPASEEKGNPA